MSGSEKLTGAYLLLLRMDKTQSICIGKMGVLPFPAGFYIYVGSAMNGLEARVNRHLRRNKKYHWHIDYLLDHAYIYEAVLIPSVERLECVLGKALSSQMKCIPRFGSSDCACKGHLFCGEDDQKIENTVTSVIGSLNLCCIRRPIA
jgi:sugar fermentation stimulation protein A